MSSGFQDGKIHPRSLTSRHIINVPVGTSTSITSRVFSRIKPGVKFQLTDLALTLSTYTATLGVDAKIGSDNCVLVAGALTVHSTPEQLALALSRYVVGGKVVEKAAATAIAFSAAHAITATKWGCVVVMTNNAGTISTKVAAATQAYDTEAEARAAEPAPDAGKIKIALITIQAGGSQWDAITDDLTAASDLASIDIDMVAAQPSALTGSIAPIAQERVAATLSTSTPARRGEASDTLYLLYTTDGTAALANAMVEVRIRARTNQLFAAS